MYILIDNTNDGEVVFFSVLDTKLVQSNFTTSGVDTLLLRLEQWLKNVNKTKLDIQGLGVVVGKGRFTNTRVAVTAVNTLGFALGVPVVGLGDSNFDFFVDKIKEVPTGQYISAKYSGEAHIGNIKSKNTKV